MRDAGARRLSDLTQFDAAVTTAYNTEGYIDYLTMRGFVVDNRFNYRRDGLPINAETSIPLENKARVDILKGSSGMQAGTSAPGGLVDFIVKRPLDAPLRSAFVEWRERGSVLGAVDLSQRFGADDAFGVRLNAAAEHIDPSVRDARGNRNLFALAGDWRVGAATLIEAEVENSHRSQPSVPGFSLLGDARARRAADPRLNLNNQPWSQPVVFDATTASLRVTQKLGDGWRIVAHGLDAAPAHRRPHRVPVRLQRPEPPPDGTYYPTATARTATSTSTISAARTSAPERHARPRAARRVATGALAHALAVGVLRTLQNRFQASGVQLRRHRQRRRHARRPARARH